MSEGSSPYKILFVCTANICRSPAAEVLARHKYGEELAWFRSAGFLSAGEVSPPHLVTALRELGVDVTRHRSFMLNEPSLVAADLVLTMEGDHVQRATMLHQASFPKIVPLKEAAFVMASTSAPMSVDDLLALVNRERNPSTYLSYRWDVTDPFNRKLSDYRRAVADIAQLVDAVIGRLV